LYDYLSYICSIKLNQMSKQLFFEEREREINAVVNQMYNLFEIQLEPEQEQKQEEEEHEERSF